MLRNVGIDFNKLDANIIIQLLSEQLRLYQSSFSYNTTIQQIEILETLLKHYFLNQRPIQRAIALIDLAKLIRISKPNKIQKTSTPRKKRGHFNDIDDKSDDMEQLFNSLNFGHSSDGTSADDEEQTENRDPNIEIYDDCHGGHISEIQDRNPLNLLAEAIDLLTEVKKIGVDDNEIHLEDITDDILATGYLWTAICKRESYATQKAMESQMDDLNQSMVQLELEPNQDALKNTHHNNNNHEDQTGLHSMLQAMDIWSNLISKHCKSKCKHLSKNTKDADIRECNKCHKSFRNLFSTIQHLQIILDYMHLNRLIAKEIFILDRMIRLLSTMSDTLEWCREYRLLCLCWSGMAYLRFGNSNEARKIFDELHSVLLPTTPDISIYLYHHIQIIYAQYQAITNNKQGMQSLLTLKKQFEQKRSDQYRGSASWEDIYLSAKIKCVLAKLQIKVPQLFQVNDSSHFNEADIDPMTLAKDSLLRFTTLVDKLNQQFTFKHHTNRHQNGKQMSTYNAFIESLPSKKYQFFQASSQQYISTHHPQSVLHGSHTKMLYHYPSEFRLIAEFLECIKILGGHQAIVHQPRMSLYHYGNGNKAANNLVVVPQQKLFLIDLAKLQSKKNDWQKYDEYMQMFQDISCASTIKLSSSFSRKIYGSLAKVTPYAPTYDTYMIDILSMECKADCIRYKGQYKMATQQYQQCLSIIQSFFDAKPAKQSKINTTKSDFVPLLKLQCVIKRKLAACLLHLRDINSLQQCQDICLQILSEQHILDDLLIAKTKLCISQCSILQLQNQPIMHIIWKGSDETFELQSILQQNMNQQILDFERCHLQIDIEFANKYDTNHIAMIIYIRQNLIQSLLILIHLNTVDPELIKQTAFALAYIYGHTHIQWTAMFLNIAQSVITRQGAIKQYAKQLHNIKQQWHDFKVAQKKHSRESTRSNSRNHTTYNSRESSVEPRDPNNVNIKDLTMSMRKLKLNKKHRNMQFNEDDYLTHEQYNTLYTRFHHKLSTMRYHNEDQLVDYNDLKCCRKLIDIMCDTFYSQTVEYLQCSWNCVSMEVDHLLRTMLVCVINPSSTSRHLPTDVVIVDIPINRNQNEMKQEEDDDDDGFLQSLYFENDRNDNNENEINPNHKYDKIMNDFNAFLIEANQSTHSGKECVGKEEVKLWWENRYKLDKTLKNHLQDIESDILGIFRCLFLPNFRHKQTKKLMNSSCDALIKAINEYLLKKSNNHYASTCYTQQQRDNNLLIRSPKMILFEKMVQLLFICYQENTVHDDEIKQGLSYIFNVIDNYILNKLLDTVKSHIINIHKKFASKVNTTDFEPLILSIGDTLKHLPWENLPILKATLPSICRIPCLEFAALRVLEYSKYNNKDKRLKYYYIINPKGDLKKTESRFNRLLNDEWEGIKGEIPSFDQFRDGLEKNDVFLYVGHNGGEEFVHCTKLEEFNIESITFLMGCSSGLLKKKGRFQSNGITNYYMIASCPIVVANLWDVTDKDIDQFSCQMLRKCILKQNNIVDIPKAVNMSRSVCKLKYLNGAAPICYGIPFHLLNGVYV